MSTSVSPSSEGAPRGLAAAFGLAVCLVAVGYLATWGESRPQVDLRLDSWRPSADELAAEREHRREALADFAMGAEEGALVAQLERYSHALDRVGGDAGDVTVRNVHADLSAALVNYAQRRGVARYHAFGLALSERFVAALESLLAEVRARGERLSTYLERHPVSPSVVAFRALGGGFLQQALRAGLLQDDGRLPSGGGRMAGLFFLVRWFGWVQSVTDYTFRLSPAQLGSFWAWKAEQSHNLSVARRMELVGKVAQVWPDYPADYVRAVLLARAERWVHAIPYWRRWLAAHPEDRRTREALRFAEELAAP